LTTRTYSSAEAFKRALEQRLRTLTQGGAEFARKRQLLVFNRFLARLDSVVGDAVTLKGGLAPSFTSGVPGASALRDRRKLGAWSGGVVWQSPLVRHWQVGAASRRSRG